MVLKGRIDLHRWPVIIHYKLVWEVLTSRSILAGITHRPDVYKDALRIAFTLGALLSSLLKSKTNLNVIFRKFKFNFNLLLLNFSWNLFI